MASELRVPAIKAQARRMVEDWEGPQRGSKPAMIAVIKDLLAALDAQAARLANAAEMGKVLDALLADKAAAEQRATRLAALEQAARAWADSHGLIHCWHTDKLRDAIADLDTPSGDSA